ncbi:hypothetical protein BD779DRAFT_1626434 [Infundibulicybe gibba]|nr:hypothetical protein BD779DRAFT_1626434 [Infundibulicybe gibba]
MPCPNCSCTSCLPVTPSPPMSFPSPPSELTATNRAPTDSEIAHSQVVISSVEKRVSMIQAMLDDLDNQKAKLLALIATHKAAVSRLKRFPPEILADLFAECFAMIQAESPSTHQRSTRSLRCPPLMVMGVCSRWREIVLDTPRLWTKILTAPPMIDSWIIRSKGLPLDVRLNLSQGGARAYSALDALIPHAHRWERVDFSLGPKSNFALALVKTRLQSLKRLKLSFDRVTGAMDFCEVAPQLTEIWLERISQPIVINLPWEQLQVSTLDDGRAALYFLRQAKNIQTCRLKQPSMHIIPWLSSLRGRFRHLLDTLIIDGWCQEDRAMFKFFASLTLPSLRTLNIHFPQVMESSSDGDSDSDESDDDRGSVDSSLFSSIFFKFFKRSSTHLNNLTLIDIPFPQDQFIDCLASAQSLVSLDIQYDDESLDWADDEFLHALTWNTDLPRSILPCLSSLFLRGHCHLSERALDAFVTSRRDINPMGVPKVALLENLALDCSPPWSWSEKPHRPPLFHRFVPEGLSIEYGPCWEMHDTFC